MNHFFIGCSFLALLHKNFPTKQAMKCFEGIGQPAITFLWGTFGTKKSNLKPFFEMNKDKPHLVQVYLTNGVCIRKRNCKRGEVCRKDTSSKWNRKLRKKNLILKLKLKARVRSVKKTLEKHGNENSRFVLVPQLEDNLTNGAAREFIKIIREVWPYEVVRNPVGNNPYKHLSGADALELHHINAPLGGTILYASNDGEDIHFNHRDATLLPSINSKSVRGYLSRAKSSGVRGIFLWAGLWQGLRGDSGGAPPPRRRNCEVPSLDTQAINIWLREVQ